MKNAIISYLAIVLAVIAILLYALNHESRDGFIRGNSPKDLIMNILLEVRWDGTGAFLEAHRKEISNSLEIANILENDGVAIIFASFRVEEKKYRLSQWAKKTKKGWEYVAYVSSYTSNPWQAKWIEKHKDWLDEMNEKRKEWEQASESIW